MWKDFWTVALANPDFASIFTIAILILGVQTAIKYITKLPVFLKEPPDKRAIRAAHFDCLRMGLDLSLLGLVAAFAVFQLAVKAAQQGQATQIATFQTEFTCFQFFLIVWAIFFTMRYESPEKNFYRGIWIPSMIGFLSVYSSILAFKFFKLG
jgi:hypothetical protein